MPLLVQDAVQRRAAAQTAIPASPTKTTIRIQSDSNTQAPALKLKPNEWHKEGLQGYLESYGQALRSGTGTAAEPQEIERLLSNPKAEDVGVKDILGCGLLHYAVEREMKSTVKALLGLRADPNAWNCILRTPLHQAVIENDAEIVSELLTYGANPNQGDVEGWTPLHFAIQLSHVKCLAVLFNFTPDIHAVNKSGKTPKDYIKEESVRVCVEAYERLQRDSSGCQDSVETADVSQADSPKNWANGASFSHGKVDPSDPLSRKERCHSGDSPQELRVQRPNEESGAIAFPHPKSAYS
jgi:ankyrin repeat protein